MKPILALLLSLIASTAFAEYEIKDCFINFKDATDLTWVTPDHLPKSSNLNREVETGNGKVTITRTEGYRIYYNNEKGEPFVNLKVELSGDNNYEADKKAILANLNYINSHTPGSETKDLIELTFNGYKVYGSSRSSIEKGMFLGTFVIFAGNGVTLYVYFQNIKPELRHFNSFEDYKRLRNKFLQEYTKYLKHCH